MPDPDPDVRAAPAEGGSSRPRAAVFDVDGVVADVRHRLHFVERRPKDWTGFFEAMGQDAPLAIGVELARDQAALGHRIVYLTGRNESYRAVTSRWMREHGLPEGRLIMRRDDDRRPARQFKPQALRRIARDCDVVAVVDDDLAVVEVLRRDGWPVLHATWMDAEPEAQQSLFDAQELDGRT